MLVHFLENDRESPAENGGPHSGLNV